MTPSKTLCRMIAPKWLTDEQHNRPKVLEGMFSEDEITQHNADGYNVYYLPNHPSDYQPGTNVDGSMIDVFNYVFVDFDLKSNTYADKDAFIEAVGASAMPQPTRIVDSGGGIHAYWRVADLDATSYLRLSRRAMRCLNTDEAVGQIFQLMRLPNTVNTKFKDDLRLCETLIETDAVYTCEELDKALPPITVEDEAYCQQHYDKTYKLDRKNVTIDDVLPPKFGKLIAENHEAKELFAGNTSDRSKNDYRLAHIMFANKFTKEEAASVLVNSAKAMARAPLHRVNYAQNIIDKIWTYEAAPENGKLKLSSSVADILIRAGDTLEGTPFRCHKRIDNTVKGFRLGQVIGLVAGSGVGKTAFALNTFQWFVEQNPDYHHFFVSLEQPDNEIAERWQTMTQGNTTLHNKVHIIGNYDEVGNFRQLSFNSIRDYLLEWQKSTGLKVGCVVIDHIGALEKGGKKEENQDLMTICHAMKAFAVQTNTLLIMQSQTSREKSGIGDLELNKDAAYGTTTFEWYCDYLITMWQPLKRCHADEACPTVTAFKYCKIRHKKKQDVIKEDVPYYLYFDSDTETFKDMTQDQKTSFAYFLPQATNKRKADRKTELVAYISVPYNEGAPVAATTNGDRLSTRH
jgi:KaiC/GvpD/RAD55 family RecA-like ATPase